MWPRRRRRMDTVVQLRCDACGDNVMIPARMVRVTEHPQWRVVYDCPACNANVGRDVAEATAARLLSAGARRWTPLWARGAELPPITLDELLETHEHLDEEIAQAMDEWT